MENKYRAEAKEKWGRSARWEAYEQRAAAMTEEKYAARDEGMRDIFRAFAALGADADPAGAEAQAQARRSG